MGEVKSLFKGTPFKWPASFSKILEFFSFYSRSVSLKIQKQTTQIMDNLDNVGIMHFLVLAIVLCVAMYGFRLLTGRHTGVYDEHRLHDGPYRMGYAGVTMCWSCCGAHDKSSTFCTPCDGRCPHNYSPFTGCNIM